MFSSARSLRARLTRLALLLTATAAPILAADQAPTIAPTTPNPGLRYYYPVPALTHPQTIEVDVCVYGGTPAGVGAAVQARRMGKSAALFVFRRHVGGMTSGGLTAVDVGKIASIGGMAADFLKRAAQAKFESAKGISPELGFRPSQAETIFRTMLGEAGVPVYFEHRLKSVEKHGDRIVSLTFENGQVVRAAMFVDATYEGDLLPGAGVRFTTGREDNAMFGETVNGFQISKTHQFRFPTDPYRTPGDPSSGLLPGITAGPLPKPGTGDALIQPYNFRMWAVAANKGAPWPKPADYRREDYALLERYITSAPADFVWDWTYRHGPVKLNIGDCNNAGPISTDLVHGSQHWFELNYAQRERIFQAHVTYQQGMMWFLANDPAMPEAIRKHAQRFGLPRDEFSETSGWPHELYVREARRMLSDYVMTERNCLGQVVASDSVGLASYNMDSHHTSRVIVDGAAMAEGCIEKPAKQPYPISYRAIVPRLGECANLLVPVAVSSTHVAFGSIRMEPVFMLLGQSAGTAAALAIDAKSPVQRVDYTKLRDQLLRDGQRLEWTSQLEEQQARPTPAKKTS
jgi:hypothetical protein